MDQVDALLVVAVEVKVPQLRRSVREGLDQRRQMAGASLQQVRRSSQHAPTGEVEAEVEAAGLHPGGLAPGCDCFPVLQEVVEAVVEGGVPSIRAAIEEVPAGSCLDVHFARMLYHHPVAMAIWLRLYEPVNAIETPVGAV